MNCKCRKFRKLVDFDRDRALSLRERSYLDRHRSGCGDCWQFEQVSGMALNMLSAFEFESEPQTDRASERKILRRARVQFARGTVQYWSPALVGVAIGVLAMASVIQLVARPGGIGASTFRNTDARRDAGKNQPFPEIRSINRFDR